MRRTAGPWILALGLLGACAHAPRSAEHRADLERSAQNTVQQMTNEHSDVSNLMSQAAGYLVFPEVKAGGFVVGGAGGAGIAYQNGRRAGYAELRQASVGALAGGERYAEMIIVRDQQTFDRIKGGDFDVGAQAQAVVLKAGAGTATQFGPSGVAVLVRPTRGAMVNASISGQRITIKQ